MMGRIGKRLWNEIEKEQGFAYISDAVEIMNDEAVMKIVWGAIPHAENVVKILKRFAAKKTPPSPSRSRNARTDEDFPSNRCSKA